MSFQVDTHGKNFKIATHIRDAEAELLLQYRLKAEAQPSLVNAFATQQQQHGATTSPPLSPRQMSARAVAAAPAMPSSSSSTSSSSIALRQPQQRAMSVSQLALERVHNCAWKNDWLNNRRWYEGQDTAAAKKFSIVSQYDTVDAASPSSSSASASASSTTAAATTVVGGVTVDSVPANTKLGKILNAMETAEPIELLPLPTTLVLDTMARRPGDPLLFGVALERVPLVSFRNDEHIPQLVADCVDYLKATKDALSTEGIFRLSGAAKDVQRLHDLYERGAVARGTLAEVVGDSSVHTVANLLKLYLRKLPEPLIPSQLYDSLLDIMKTTHSTKTARIASLRAVASAIAASSKCTLFRFLCRYFCNEVVALSDKNGMTSVNVAIVIAPSFLRAREQRVEAAAEASKIVPAIVEAFIIDSREIFE